jgi:putative OPT family oligopeptide transporter
MPNEQNSKPEFKPFISHTTLLREFSLKALMLGIFFGLVFGAATVYLGLKIGLTVSASIPIAVLSIVVLKKFGQSTILENNIVQTIGSAGESIAAGVTFTIPALVLLGYQLQYSTIFILAIIGGILGVFFMIPLRRLLIVREHGKLPYPEGTACADVLIAGEQKGALAQKVFMGLGAGFLYKSMMSVLNLWKETPSYALKSYKGAIVDGEISPELLGVGYIIGPRIAGVMVAGGVLASLVLIPLIKIFGDLLPIVIPPGKTTISNMSPGEIWHYYIRYIGGGAVVFGGLVTLVKALPTIYSAFRDSMKEVFKTYEKGADHLFKKIRTEKDIPTLVTILGSLILIFVIAKLPFLPGNTFSHVLAAIMIVIFGFFFVTVSSRIVGLIGSSSNPISGMTITTLMITCLIFVALGWTGHEYTIVALSIGAIVCIAAANGGNTSQDLKTGYIVGATPFWQQIGLIIGVITSSVVIGITLIKMHSVFTIGSSVLPAPKAQLMTIIIEGVLTKQLPWDLILVGFFIGAVIQLCGVEVLPFAVGTYLPMSVSTPIFVGGMINYFINKFDKIKESEAELSPGVLYSSGLIAGGALTMIGLAVLKSWPYHDKSVADFLNIGERLGFTSPALGYLGDVIAFLCFNVLCVTLILVARMRNNKSI